jgi:hypothetical protein
MDPLHRPIRRFDQIWELSQSTPDGLCLDETDFDSELALEHRAHPLIRFFPAREDAQRWLRD